MFSYISFVYCDSICYTNQILVLFRFVSSHNFFFNFARIFFIKTKYIFSDLWVILSIFQLLFREIINFFRDEYSSAP